MVSQKEILSFIENECIRSLKEDPSFTVDQDGIMRWDSNGQVPFDDMIEAAEALGFIVNRKLCAKVREEENIIAIKEYILSQQNETEEMRAEREFEMRAAFGPGETVVNVLTGRTYRT